MTLGSEHNDNLIHRQEQICHLSRIYLAQSTSDIKHKEHDNEVKAHDIELKAHDIECKAHVIRHKHRSWKF